MWSPQIKSRIVESNGSIQDILEIPADVRELYKTVWEIKQKAVLDMAIDRGAYIDQSQSLNIHLANPTFAQLSRLHTYGWQGGLKTGMYYLRTRAAAEAIKFTVEKDAPVAQEATDGPVCTMEEGCLSCGS